MGIQDERRQETRARLLEAAVACLVERGYANLTTAEVAQRAGVSKGAQLYHFPKKDDLVVAALEHLFNQRIEASKKILSELPKDIGARIDALVDGLWPAYNDSVFYAWLELAIASRTDLALRDAVLRISQKFGDEVVEMWRSAFPEIPGGRDSFLILSQIINGEAAWLGLSKILVEPDPSRENADVQATLSVLKEIGNFLLQRMGHSQR